MDWDNLRFFLAVTEHGSVSAAAQSLAVNHATVSRRISALEQELGLKLFHRLPQTWVMTDVASEVLEQAQRVASTMLDIRRTADASSSAGGVVRVSAPPALLEHFLAPRMARFTLNATVELLADQEHAALTQGEAEIALRLSRPTEQTVTARLLANVAYGLFGRRDYLQNVPSAQWRFLMYHSGLAHLPHQKWLEQFRAARAVTLRSNNLGVLCEAANANAGLVVLPHYLAKRYPALALVENANCPYHGQLWLLVHQDVRRSPHVRQVAQAISELFVRPLADLSDSF